MLKRKVDVCNEVLTQLARLTEEISAGQLTLSDSSATKKVLVVGDFVWFLIGKCIMFYPFGSSPKQILSQGFGYE